MPKVENIEAIEKRMWNAADTLRANSNYASNEYFLPVMGLIFLRHAYRRYLDVKDEIIAALPKRGGKVRELKKEDFSQRSAIFLRDIAQYDYLVNIPNEGKRAEAIISAMQSIEDDYESLKGMLPKAEYQELDDDVLGTLIKTFNLPELNKISGDVFGRIYEYFLTQFADLKAHDNGEFFTPISLVSFIANVLEPEKGIILDPACGSGGMFVQSAHFVERQNVRPADWLTFYGLEKNPTTIRLAKMNLAVHGLEGDIQKAITYYEDPHDLNGKADFVMANPPFNVDEVDASKICNDERLPFGLPGVNKSGKVSNGNYLWISYFYSYLNEKGRAGFVMSSQASSAGRDEALVRQKLIETGDVDIMVSIRSNFFYTRTVPCELWFLNRDKPAEHRDKVLMLDARNIYRKVTRKIYDFSPEQLNNLLAIVWLYRGQEARFRGLIADYIKQCLDEAEACYMLVLENGETVSLLDDYVTSIEEIDSQIRPFCREAKEGLLLDAFQEYDTARQMLKGDVNGYGNIVKKMKARWVLTDDDLDKMKAAVEDLATMAEQSHDLLKLADHVYKVLGRIVDISEKDCDARENEAWSSRDIAKLRKAADNARQIAVEQLKQVRYFYKQSAWLLDRFPDGRFRDVKGLVKLTSIEEIKSNDWSLTPGRYVGVAPEEVDEDFDFEEALRDVHIELEGLNAEAMELAQKITRNFKELGI